MRWKLLFILFLMSLASATPEIYFQHEKIQPEETILATINTSGEFQGEIKESQIKFLEGRKEVFFESNIFYYNNTYYFYSYTTRPGNFTLKISNILYKEGQELTSKNIEKDFTIKEERILNEETNKTETKILEIKPGFVKSSTTPKIKITNKGDTTFNVSYLEKEITINPLKSSTIEYAPDEEFTHLEISTYKDFRIPINYLSAIKPIIKKTHLKSKPKHLVAEANENSEKKEIITLYNLEDENITIQKIISSLDFISVKSFEEIKAREVKNLTIIISPEKTGHATGNITVYFIEDEIEEQLIIPLSLFILPKGTTLENISKSEETCKDLKGNICNYEEICDSKTTFTKGNELCCLGKCIPKEKDDEDESGYGWLIGILIIVGLGGGAYFLYKKSKKVKGTTPDEKIKQTTEKYSKRLSGNLKRN